MYEYCIYVIFKLLKTVTTFLHIYLFWQWNTSQTNKKLYLKVLSNIFSFLLLYRPEMSNETFCQMTSDHKLPWPQSFQIIWIFCFMFFFNIVNDISYFQIYRKASGNVRIFNNFFFILIYVVRGGFKKIILTDGKGVKPLFATKYLCLKLFKTKTQNT